MKAIQVFSAFVALVVMACFVLLVFRKIEPLYFWAIMIVAAVFAYAVLPRLHKL